MINQVCVDRVLEVPSPVVGQEYVYRLGPRIGFVFGRDNRVVDGMDDVRMGREEGVGFHFFQGERDGFLAKGTADLLQSVELGCRCILDQIDVRKAPLIARSQTSQCSVLRPGGLLTSPSRCCILKLRLFIFNCGDPGKQKKQFVRE